MTRDQLLTTLTRWVFPSIHFNSDGDRTSYLDSIYGLCGRYDGLKFDEAVKHVMEAWKTGHKPQAGHFSDAFKFLAKEQGWYTESDRTCSDCGGSGFRKIRVTRIQDEGKEHNSLDACPRCRSKWTRKEDLIVIETPEENYYLKTARAMSPSGAAFVLDQIEAGKFKPPAEIYEQLLAVLLERGALAAPKTPSPFAEILEAAQVAAAEEVVEDVPFE